MKKRIAIIGAGFTGLTAAHELIKRGVNAQAALSIDLIRSDEEISRNFPRLTDLVDHVDSERASARENLGRTRARAQELGKLALGVPQLLDLSLSIGHRRASGLSAGPCARLSSRVVGYHQQARGNRSERRWPA